jgi:DNA repair protein RadA/Sms
VLQALTSLAARGDKVLYVTGEESLRQVRMRAERLGPMPENLFILAETALETIIAHIMEERPAILVVDSVQTVYAGELESAPGSVSQLRESSARLINLAKQTDTATFLIGHVTKDGAIAGPRVLEHMVDTVLYFEGDRGHAYRILRAVKNRFGSTDEIGVFEMGQPASGRLRAPPSFLFPSGLKARRAQPSCPALKERARSLWRCRPSPRPLPLPCPGAPPSASTRTARRCWLRYWKKSSA